MRPEIQAKLDALPDGPGVYLMKDRSGSVFYIGKAKSLRQRVRGYVSGADTRAFVALLDELLDDLEVVLTASAKDALILENELIKQHQPRFNVKLTDDSRYLCLRLDVRHPYGRLEVVRRFGKDGARYFGPYDSASAIRETLRIINRHFQLRTCSDQVLRSRKRPCLQHQIKRCPAPCVLTLPPGEYSSHVQDVIAFLEGRTDALLRTLAARMQARAEAMDFEAAAVVRDQIRALERSLQRQRVVSRDFIDRDVIGVYRQGAEVQLQVMRTREGRLMDARRFALSGQEMPTADLLGDFVSRYYVDGVDAPDEILIPDEMEWAGPLASLLTETRRKKVRIITPQRGEKKKLLTLAARNAEQAFRDRQREAGAARTAVERLQRSLRLERAPRAIECFDISHFQGVEVVASCVRFDNGVPNKDLYRRFRIRSVEGQDDFQSMYETLSRRARRGLEQGDLPDLVVIDGGKGQLAAARAALADHGVDGVDLVGLAKARLQKPEPATTSKDAVPSGVTRSFERVFVLGRKDPIILGQDSAELFLLTRARDEAHRFAIAYHRKLRQKAASRSVLDGIAGVGPKRRAALLKAFGSVARLRQAEEREVAAVVGRRAARAVTEALADPKAGG